MQKITVIRKKLNAQFETVHRLEEPTQESIQTIKLNTPFLSSSDIDTLHNLIHEHKCNVKVKRSGKGLVIVII